MQEIVDLGEQMNIPIAKLLFSNVISFSALCSLCMYLGTLKYWYQFPIPRNSDLVGLRSGYNIIDFVKIITLVALWSYILVGEKRILQLEIWKDIY